MIKLLHFADAHIDMARQGRRDPESGLPLRVLDFLQSLDTIIDTALQEKVDLVIFAGDAYRDRTPSPTYQREWGKRIMRLSDARIETILVVGNHDVSPASGRAHTLQEFETLQVPHVHVVAKPQLLHPGDLNGLQVQVIGIPWLNRSGLVAAMETNHTAIEGDQINDELEKQLTMVIEGLMENLDPSIPTILTSHISVQGAVYGNERSVMLGKDIVLAGSLVKDQRFDYVALGHIHKSQNLNPDAHPPVIYPGSIERIDFGEINDRKTCVLAQIEKGRTAFEWKELSGRQFISTSVEIEEMEDMQCRILDALPPADRIKDAIVRLSVTYPKEWEAMIDETAVRRAAETAFSFHFVRKPVTASRQRFPGGKPLGTLPPGDLVHLYWQSMQVDKDEIKHLGAMADDIIQTVQGGEDEKRYSGEQPA